MPDFRYHYIARDLVGPLDKLITFLKNELIQSRDELAALGDKPPVSHMRPATVGDVRRDQLVMKTQRDQRDLYRASLWLSECLRSHKATFVLDTTEIEWLYRYRQWQILGLSSPTALPAM